MGFFSPRVTNTDAHPTLQLHKSQPVENNGSGSPNKVKASGTVDIHLPKGILSYKTSPVPLSVVTFYVKVLTKNNNFVPRM